MAPTRAARWGLTYEARAHRAQRAGICCLSVPQENRKGFTQCLLLSFHPLKRGCWMAKTRRQLHKNEDISGKGVESNKLSLLVSCRTTKRPHPTNGGRPETYVETTTFMVSQFQQPQMFCPYNAHPLLFRMNPKLHVLNPQGSTPGEDARSFGAFLRAAPFNNKNAGGLNSHRSHPPHLASARPGNSMCHNHPSPAHPKTNLQVQQHQQYRSPHPPQIWLMLLEPKMRCPVLASQVGNQEKQQFPK